MIHAKTIVADGWWSKVGSTNMNFSSLSANWELDLVAEDRGFGSQMERLFEEDLSNAREIRLQRTARRQQVRPDRPIRSEDRQARRGVVGSGSGASATALRVGSAALQRGSAPLQTHEQAIATAASVALLGSSLLAFRFPRLVAWPLAIPGALFGGLGAVRALRSALSDTKPPLVGGPEPMPVEDNGDVEDRESP
jgi:cardiolipin synthase